MKTQALVILGSDELLTGMLGVVEKVSKDFSLVKQAYERSISMLRIELGDERIERFLNAVNLRSKAELLFCANLGYQENLKNFRDPISRTFMDVDFDTYLRLEILGRMPQRQSAEAEINFFYCLLNEKQKEIYEDVYSYLLSLELDLTKLAHYVGFMFANEMLIYTEVGYTPNITLSLRYQNFLGEWFDIGAENIMEVAKEFCK